MVCCSKPKLPSDKNTPITCNRLRVALTRRIGALIMQLRSSSFAESGFFETKKTKKLHGFLSEKKMFGDCLWHRTDRRNEDLEANGGIKPKGKTRPASYLTIWIICVRTFFLFFCAEAPYWQKKKLKKLKNEEPWCPLGCGGDASLTEAPVGFDSFYMRRLFPPPTPPPPPLLSRTLGMFSNTDAVVGMQLNAHKGIIQSYVWISRNGNYFSALVCYTSTLCSVFFMSGGRPPWNPLYSTAYNSFSLSLGWDDAMWKLLLVTEFEREARRRF